MIARPILMSAPMIRALLEGRKTQTRRIAKHPSRYAQIEFLGGGGKDSPDWNDPQCWGYADEDGIYYTLTGKPGDDICPCPFGRAGGLLWVREAHAVWDDGVVYRASNPECDGITRWVPSIHMPRWASRLTLELTDVRVERLQDISEADAVKEGFAEGKPVKYFETATDQFRRLWESINGEGSWHENPWVWVLAFKVHKCNVDALMEERAA
jgi:hypothetical protein